jgi:hypothetical protein
LERLCFVFDFHHGFLLELQVYVVVWVIGRHFPVKISACTFQLVGRKNNTKHRTWYFQSHSRRIILGNNILHKTIKPKAE